MSFPEEKLIFWQWNDGYIHRIKREGLMWSDEHPLEWVEPHERLIAADEALDVMEVWMQEAIDADDYEHLNSLISVVIGVLVRDMPVRIDFT